MSSKDNDIQNNQEVSDAAVSSDEVQGVALPEGQHDYAIDAVDYTLDDIGNNDSAELDFSFEPEENTPPLLHSSEIRQSTGDDVQIASFAGAAPAGFSADASTGDMRDRYAQVDYDQGVDDEISIRETDQQNLSLLRNSSDQTIYDFGQNYGVSHTVSVADSLTTAGLVTNGSAYEFPSESEIKWHHDAVNARETWEDYTGTGVVVAVIDNGWHSYFHADLNDNIRFDLADQQGQNGEDHGQNTIGLVGAEANGFGTVGMAYNADLVPEVWAVQGLIDARSYADVMNNSWSYSDLFLTYGLDKLEDAVEYGRGGLGSVVVFSAGNSRTDDLSANATGLQNSPHSITVAAMDPDGTETWFSSEGSSILVTAPGINLSTTDGSNSYIDNFAGTSGSAPIVSGVAALILEANPDLGYRDVHQIFAYSTQFNDSNGSDWQYNGAENWNGGGLHFSHNHGFGLVDARAAVRLAETWDEQSTLANMDSFSQFQNVGSTIPDNGSVLQASMNIGGSNLLIETVEINVDINNHGEVGDLIIEITSPDGTVSTLLETLLYGETGVASLDYAFTSQAFRGEDSQGTWTIEIRDVSGGNVGVFSDWELTFNGSLVDGNDTYFYSDDYALYSDNGRTTLTDVGGTDTINASMVTGDITIDLNAGSSNTIAGQSLNIGSSTVIEHVYAGDGDDTITGNQFDNNIWGGRGSDTIDGGDGYDIATFLDSFDDFDFSFNGSTLLAELANNVVDAIDNVEEFIFDGVSYLYSELYSLFGDVNNDAPTVTVSDGSIAVASTTLASTFISATDAEGDSILYKVWDGTNSSQRTRFLLNGQEVENDDILSAVEFAQLQIVSGAVNSSETFYVQVKDAAHDWSSWSSFDVDVIDNSNQAPTVTVQSGTVEVGAAVDASTFITAVDADDDAITYRLWDDSNTDGVTRFVLNGQEVENGQELTAAEFAQVQIVAGAADSTQELWVQVKDVTHDWSSWKSFDVEVTPAANEAPTLTVQNGSMDAGDVIAASTLISATDAEGDAISYRLYDYSDDDTSTRFLLNGQEVANGQELTAAEFAQVQIIAGNTQGADQLQVQVKDAGHNWSGASVVNIDVTVPDNDAPTLTVLDGTIAFGATVSASDYASATDPEGDAISYRVRDNSDSDGTTRFLLNGQEVFNQQELTASEFAQLQITSGTAGSTQTLSVSVKDATNVWSNWSFFDIQVSADENAAPDLTVQDGTLDIGATVVASTFITASDADGDAITYKVWDNADSDGVTRFVLNGQEVANNQELSAAEFAQLQITAGSVDTSRALWVQVKDAGHDWSSWLDFDVTVSGPVNEAPTFTVQDGTIGEGSSVAVSDYVSATDAEGDAISYRVWDDSDSDGVTRFVLNGQEVANNQELSAAEFAQLQVTAGGVDTSRTLWVQVKDAGHDWSGWKEFDIAVSASANEAPTVTVQDAALDAGDIIAASTLVSASDTEGDAISYRLVDNSDGASHTRFYLNGQEVANGQALTAAEFAQLQIIAGSTGGVDQLTVQVKDANHDWSDAATINVTVTAAQNEAPTVTVQDGEVDEGGAIAASSLISASDADGDAISYRVWDNSDSADNSRFYLNGQEVADNQVLTAAEFAQLQIVAGDVDSTRTLHVQVKDAGHDWSDWQEFDISVTPAPNDAPTVTVQDGAVEFGTAIAASTLVSASDAEGDAISYKVWDGTDGGDASRFYLNGQEVADNQVLTAAEFAQLQIVAGDVNSTRTLYVQVKDAGHDWSSWAQFSVNVTAPQNDAPAVTVQDGAVDFGDIIAASTLISASDTEGDAISYKVWDNSDSAGSTRFLLNGQEVLNNQELTAAEFAQLQIVAGAGDSTNTLYVQVKDALHDWSDWAEFDVTVGAEPQNDAPTVTVQDAALDAGDIIAASTLVSASDTEGDAISYRVVDNSDGASTTRFLLNGQEVANGQELTAAEFAQLQIVAGVTDGTDQLTVQVKDANHDWSAAATINIDVTAPVNEGPDVTVQDGTIDFGDSIAASTLVSAIDPEGDAISYKVWDDSDSAGSTRFRLNGQEVSNGQELTAAEFAQLQIVAGDSGTTDTLYVQVKDAGHDWSDWAELDVTVNSDVNEAPNLSVQDGSVAFAVTVAATDFITATDPDGDVLTYKVWDNSNRDGKTRFLLNGQEVENNQELTAAEFAQLQIVAGDAGTTQSLWVQVRDSTHDYTNWAEFTVDVGADNNDAPTVTTQNVTLLEGNSASAADYITATDPDGDTIAYRVWDDLDGAGNTRFTLNGQDVANNQELTAAEFAQLQIVAGAGESTNTLYVQVKDAGHDWSEWESLIVTVDAVDNDAPNLSVQDGALDAGNAIAASSLVSAADTEGDAISYRVTDNSDTGVRTRFVLNGQEVSNAQELTAAEFAQLQIVAGSTDGIDQLTVQVKDANHDWSAAQTVNIDVTAENANAAPVVQTQDGTIASSSIVLASEFITVADAEGDAITYRVWDDSNIGTQTRFILNGQDVENDQELTAAEFAQLQIAGGATPSTRTLWVQAKDATHDWSEWVEINIRTSAVDNEGPSVSVQDGTVAAGEAIAASLLIDATDPEGDAISYKLWDNATGASQTRFVLDGNEVGNSQVLTADEFSRLEIIGGTDDDSSILWVQVKDATHDWGSWKSFEVDVGDPNIGAQTATALFEQGSDDAMIQLLETASVQGEANSDSSGSSEQASAESLTIGDVLFDDQSDVFTAVEELSADLGTDEAAPQAVTSVDAEQPVTTSVATLPVEDDPLVISEVEGLI